MICSTTLALANVLMGHIHLVVADHDVCLCNGGAAVKLSQLAVVGVGAPGGGYWGCVTAAIGATG